MKYFRTLCFAIIALFAISSLSSCEDLLEDIISEFKIGQTWHDGDIFIKKIGGDTYWVEDDYGYGGVYVLCSFTEALFNKPYNLRVLEHYPVYRCGELRWFVRTSRGSYHVFPSGTWCNI